MSNLPKICGTCENFRMYEEFLENEGSVRYTRLCELVLPPWMPAPSEVSRIVDDHDSCSFWVPGSISDDEA